MKKITYFLFMSIMSILFLTSCGITGIKNTVPNNKANKNSTAPKVAIYMVKEPSNIEIDSKNIDKLILEKEPIVTEKDIVSYTWNDGTLLFSGGKVINWDPKSVSSFTLKNGVTISDRISKQGFKGNGLFPFVMTVNGSRIFLGEFFSGAKTVDLPKNIYIYIPLIWGDKRPVELCDISDKSLIHDKRIYNAIKSYGILNE